MPMANHRAKSLPGKRHTALKRLFMTIFFLSSDNPYSLITFKNNHNHFTERYHNLLASMQRGLFYFGNIQCGF